MQANEVFWVQTSSEKCATLQSEWSAGTPGKPRTPPWPRGTWGFGGGGCKIVVSPLSSSTTSSRWRSGVSVPAWRERAKVARLRQMQTEEAGYPASPKLTLGVPKAHSGKDISLKLFEPAKYGFGCCSRAFLVPLNSLDVSRCGWQGLVRLLALFAPTPDEFRSIPTEAQGPQGRKGGSSCA